MLARQDATIKHELDILACRSLVFLIVDTQEALNRDRKTELLAGYCEAIGRDPSTIERTMGAPVVVVDSEAEAKAALESVPPERRPYIAIGTPELAAETLRPYIEAGFTGFTFNNNIYRTPGQIARLGDLLRLVAGERAPAPV